MSQSKIHFTMKLLTFSCVVQLLYQCEGPLSFLSKQPVDYPRCVHDRFNSLKWSPKLDMGLKRQVKSLTFHIMIWKPVKEAMLLSTHAYAMGPVLPLYIPFFWCYIILHPVLHAIIGKSEARYGHQGDPCHMDSQLGLF